VLNRVMSFLGLESEEAEAAEAARTAARRMR